jgi:short-subunit dehydrogenase
MPVQLFLGGRNANALQDTADRCRNFGCDVHSFVSDVTDKDIMHHWVLDCDRRFTLDIVIANAGISGGTLGRDAAAWMESDQSIFDVNLKGVLNTISPIIPRFCNRKAGQIVLISSLAGFAPWPGAPAYATTKAAVRIYGNALAGRLRDYNVFVTTICPGFIHTPMTDVNEFPMPMKMNAPKAAAKIAKAIAKKRIQYSFPWPMALMAQFLGLIPPPLAQILLKKAPEKP